MPSGPFNKTMLAVVALSCFLPGGALPQPTDAPRSTALVEGVPNPKTARSSRTADEIRAVFEKNKGALYAIYNRALRENPKLEGKVVFELKVAPSGEVFECRVLSSTLGAPELEQSLSGRIEQFSFGAKDVNEIVVQFPIQFLPS